MENRKFGLWLVLGILLMLSGCSEGNGSETEGKSDLLKEAFPWLKGTGRTEDMTPVEIELVDERSGESLRFRIPKAYLTDTTNWEGGRQGRIKIETGLPDLKPRPGNIWITEEPGTPEYERKIRFFRNGLFIHVRALESNVSPSVAGGRRKKLNNEGYGEFEKQNEMVRGLEYYEAKCRLLKKTSDGSLEKMDAEHCIDKKYEYYITPEDEKRPWVAMKCTKLQVNEGGGCQARTHYRGWFATYIFRRNQIHRWDEFDAGVRKLLDRFLIQPDSGKTDSQG